MKLTVMKPVEVAAAFLRINVPVRYGEEDIPADFPFRRPWQKGDARDEDREHYDRWDVTVAIDNGQIQGWPAGQTGKLYMKVCDEGVYVLLNHAGEPLAEVFENYVPGCVPGEYGDYVSCEIGPDGTITRWERYCTPERVRLGFFPETDDRG